MGNRWLVRAAFVASALVFAPVIPILWRLMPVRKPVRLELETA